MSVLDFLDGRVWFLLAALIPVVLWIGAVPRDLRERDGWNRAIVGYGILFISLTLATSRLG